jgi:hypothetical protein
MRQISRRMLPALLAVLALSAVAASAAQATEGPFFKVNGKRLEAGKTAEVKITLGTGGFQAINGVDELTCKSMAVKPGAKIVGSSGANSGKFEAAFEFSSCTETSEGRQLCEAKTIVTKTLKGVLTYGAGTGLEPPRKGNFGLGFGSENNNFQITEGTCGALDGGWAFAEFRHGAKEGVDGVENELLEATSFEATQVFTGATAGDAETAGKEETIKRKLTLGALSTTVIAPSQVTKMELVSGGKWGIYTK